MSDSIHEVQRLPVADLTLDDALQPRCEIDLSLIEDYAALLMEGTELPPLAVFRDAENRLWLADGFHRLRAHQTLDRTEVPCIVHSGERAEAIRHSVIANAAHGKPRSRGDLARSYDILKREGLVEPGDADRVQALLQCSGGWAYKLTQADRDRAKRERDRTIIEKHQQGMGQREISRATGVPVQTVNDVVNRVSGNSTVEFPDSPTRGTADELSPSVSATVHAAPGPASLPHTEMLGAQALPDDHHAVCAPAPTAPAPAADPLPRYEDYVDPVALEAWYRVIKALQAFTALQPVPDLIQSPCPQVFYAVDAALPAARAWLHRFEQEFDHVKQLSEIA